MVEQEKTDRLATVRLLERRSDRPLIVDLLFASSGIEPEIVDGSSVVEVLPGLELPVASIGHLIAMKLLARDDRRRPADADDLAALSGAASSDDWDVAASAAHLIVERRANRDRDLPALLAELRARGAY